MGFWSSLLLRRETPLALSAASSPSSLLTTAATPHGGVRFSIDVASVSDFLAGSCGTAPQRIPRDEALKVPAVKRARDLVAGGVGQFPLRMYAPDGAIVPWNLLSQPELGVPGSVSVTRLVEDLMFDEVGWWRTTFTGWHGKPVEVVRLAPDSVSARRVQTHYYNAASGTSGIAERWETDPQLIRFDSPNPGLLTAGARAVRALGRLENAAANMADGVPPIDWFEPSDGVDPDDDDVIEFLNAWKAARQARGTGYVPAAFKYNPNSGFNAQQLQMAEAREFAITEIARLTGIDAEELSVSTTSRTYFNAQDRRRSLVENVYGPYMAAIEQRLSMDDVTPRGFRVAFDTSSFLRLDDAEAAQSDAVLIAAGVLTVDEAREKRGLNPLPRPEERQEPKALPAPSTEEGADA